VRSAYRRNKSLDIISTSEYFFFTYTQKKHRKNKHKIETNVHKSEENQGFLFLIEKSFVEYIFFTLQRVHFFSSEKPRACNARKSTHCQFTRSVKTSRNFLLFGQKFYLNLLSYYILFFIVQTGLKNSHRLDERLTPLATTRAP